MAPIAHCMAAVAGGPLQGPACARSAGASSSSSSSMRVFAAARLSSPARPAAAPASQLASGGPSSRAGIAGARPSRPSVASARQVTTCAMKTFKAARSVSIPLKDEVDGFPIDRYLSNCDRVVHMTFPDKQRRLRLKPGVYKVQMLPLQFFMLNFKPTVKVQTSFEKSDRALQLRVTDLDLGGLPPEFRINEQVILEVAGSMAASGEDGSREVGGSVSISLSAEVPEPFNSAPGLQQVTEQILDGVIGAMETSLVDGLVKDYRRWAAKKHAQK